MADGTGWDGTGRDGTERDRTFTSIASDGRRTVDGGRRVGDVFARSEEIRGGRLSSDGG